MAPRATTSQAGAADGRGAVIGWDIGGAHLKAARIEGGRVVAVRQAPLPLWTGLHHLGRVIDLLERDLGTAPRNAVTMTGELADLFDSRRAGVAAIASAAAERLGAGTTIYAGRAGFLPPAEAATRADDVASANWHATAALVGLFRPEALLVDMGSTTTDIIPVRAGVPATRGYGDAERMASGELVYTGAVRTPLMAVADRVPFAGRWIGVAAEYFATMADANRLLGRLDESSDQYPPADGKGKTVAESRTRLARMLGHDAADADDAAWRAVAAWFAESQLRRVHDGALLALAGAGLATVAPIVGCGVGRAQVEELARRLGRDYLDLAALVPVAATPVELPEKPGNAGAAEEALAAAASSCAPAAAVALLADRTFTRP